MYLPQAKTVGSCESHWTLFLSPAWLGVCYSVWELFLTHHARHCGVALEMLAQEVSAMEAA